MVRRCSGVSNRIAVRRDCFRAERLDLLFDIGLSFSGGSNRLCSVENFVCAKISMIECTVFKCIA